MIKLSSQSSQFRLIVPANERSIRAAYTDSHWANKRERAHGMDERRVDDKFETTKMNYKSGKDRKWEKKEQMQKNENGKSVVRNSSDSWPNVTDAIYVECRWQN